MPWLTTLSKFFWPLPNLTAMAVAMGKPAPKTSATSRNRAQPYTTSVEDHVAVQTGTLPKLVLAVWVWHTAVEALLSPTGGVGGPAATLDAGWIGRIVLRDLLITYIVAGGWDWTLYSPHSPFYEVMKPHKLNPIYPSSRQIKHDIFWSTMSTLMSSAFEIVLLHLWATGALAYTFVPGGAWWTHTATLLWLFAMPYERLVHFFLIHRMMHKWNTRAVPDVGVWLYKHVHSLHHKSRNPTAWSGVSMHPFESFMYYTAMLVPVAFGAHPLVALYTKIDLTLGALIGHDGFGAPGAASPGHWLHHKMVDCNYGENYAPLDWLFGSFAADEDDYIARFGKASAAEADKTKTH